MATKRMFDRAIIDTDKFMDMPLSAKAIYFLLGMDADDEGFVSYKKVMRVHGGNDDDIKILVAKGMIIMFESGVVVVTDWNRNNWLDSRRIKPTEYQKEKKLLKIVDDRYLLSNRLASIEESSIEQYRIEENKITPAQEAKSFFEGNIDDIYQEMKSKLSLSDNLLKSEFQKFILYWTEKNKSGTKQRWEQQSTFEVKRRLATWLGKMKDFKNNKNQPNYVL